MYASEYTTWNIPRLVVPRACLNDIPMKKSLSVECYRIFCERTIPICVITVVIISGLMAILTYQNIDNSLLMFTLSMLILISLIQIGLADYLRRTTLSPHSVLTLLLWVTVMTGCIWGLAGFVMTATTDTTISVLFSMVITGAMASGVVILCAIPCLTRLYIVAVSFPPVLGVLLHSVQPNLALAALIVCCAVYLLMLSHRIFERLLDTIRITRINSAMSDHRRAAKNQIYSFQKTNSGPVFLNQSQRLSSTAATLPGILYQAQRKNGSWVLTDISANAHTLFRYKPESLIGKSMLHLCELINMQGRSITDQDLIESASSGSCFEVRYTVSNSQGQQHQVVERGRAEFNDSGKLAFVEGILFDVSNESVLSRNDKHQSCVDILTSIPERSNFCRRLQELLGVLNHTPRGHAVILLSLDHFKIINDIYGHTAADKLLCQVSRRLAAYVKDGYSLARISEDMFGVLLKDCDEQQAKHCADNLREALSDEWYSWGKKRFNIKASIGIAATRHQSKDSETLLNRAEQACTLAREQGQDCTQIYRDRDIQIVNCQKEKYWALQIPESIAAGDLFLVCQSIAPLAECHTQNMCYEVLLRIRGPNGTIITPETFLPGAERYHLMTVIDQWVIDRVLTGLHDNPQHLAELDTCFINISGQSLGHSEFLDNVLAQLDESGISAHKLCFEITETAAIVNFPQALRFIECLKDRGAEFALDDFGSGLSTFDYLRKLPVDYLKIDGAFVRDIAHNAISRAMLSSINDFGHLTGKKTVAEFVENEAILQEVQQIGFDFVQGYGISRPVAFDCLLKGQATICCLLKGKPGSDLCSIQSNQQQCSCQSQDQLKPEMYSHNHLQTRTHEEDAGHGTFDEEFQETVVSMA